MTGLERFVQPFAPPALAPPGPRARPPVEGIAVLEWGKGGSFGDADEITATVEITTDFEVDDPGPSPQIINVEVAVSDAGTSKEELKWPDTIEFRILGIQNSERSRTELEEFAADVLKGGQGDEGIEGMTFLLHYDEKYNTPATKTEVVP